MNAARFAAMARFAEARRADLKIGAQLALEADCVYLYPHTPTGKLNFRPRGERLARAHIALFPEAREGSLDRRAPQRAKRKIRAARKARRGWA